MHRQECLRCLRLIHPQVVEISQDCAGGFAVAAEEPEIAFAVYPLRQKKAASGRIAWEESTLRAVGGDLTSSVGAADPGPFASAELPKIIEPRGRTSGVETVSSEHPGVTGSIHPCSGTLASARDIGRRRYAHRAVGAVLIDYVRAGYPRPLAPRVFPLIVYLGNRAARIESVSAEDPKISRGVVQPDAPYRAPGMLFGEGVPRVP